MFCFSLSIDSHTSLFLQICFTAAGFEGSLFQKLFKGYIFCFLGHLVGRYIFELSARETNLMKKCSVRSKLACGTQQASFMHLGHGTSVLSVPLPFLTCISITIGKYE